MGRNSVPFSETQSLTCSVTRVMGTGELRTQLSQQVRLPSVGSASVFLPKRSPEQASSPRGVYGKPSEPQKSQPPPVGPPCCAFLWALVLQAIRRKEGGSQALATSGAGGG